MEHHPDPEVNVALIRLIDALCSWERSTGRRSVLILREEGGLEVKVCDGKPLGPGGHAMDAAELLAQIAPERDLVTYPDGDLTKPQAVKP